MSAAALEARRKGAATTNARHPGGLWRTVKLRAATVAALDEARADVSRDEYIAAVVTPLHE